MGNDMWRFKYTVGFRRDLGINSKIPKMDMYSEAKCPSPKTLAKPKLRATGVTDMGPKVAKGATITGRKLI